MDLKTAKKCGTKMQEIHKLVKKYDARYDKHIESKEEAEKLDDTERATPTQRLEAIGQRLDDLHLDLHARDDIFEGYTFRAFKDIESPGNKLSVGIEAYYGERDGTPGSLLGVNVTWHENNQEIGTESVLAVDANEVTKRQKPGTYSQNEIEVSAQLTLIEETLDVIEAQKA